MCLIVPDLFTPAVLRMNYQLLIHLPKKSAKECQRKGKQEKKERRSLEMLMEEVQTKCLYCLGFIFTVCMRVFVCVCLHLVFVRSCDNKKQ